jgi:glutaredoxin 3
MACLLALLAVLVSSCHALRVPHLFASRNASFGAPLMAASSDLEQTIQQAVSRDQVVIWSKSSCPYSAQVKALFDDMSQPWVAIELDQREVRLQPNPGGLPCSHCLPLHAPQGGEQLQAALLAMTQQRTVPNVFIAGRHLLTKDLCDLRDTPQPARSGKLAALLEAGL